MESAATRRPPELRRPRQVSLSTLLGVATFLLTGTAVAVAAALTVASTTMQQATGILGDAVESVRLADRLQVDLFLDAHQLSRGAGSDKSGAISAFDEREHELRNGLAEARRYVSSPEEGSFLDDAERRVDAYLAGRRYADAGGPSASPATLAPAVDAPAFDEAFRALDRLVEINLEQARASQALVARLGRRATAAGGGRDPSDRSGAPLRAVPAPQGVGGRDPGDGPRARRGEAHRRGARRPPPRRERSRRWLGVPRRAAARLLTGHAAARPPSLWAAARPAGSAA